MNGVTYRCPVCTLEVQAAPSLAGQSAPCPRCRVHISSWPNPVSSQASQSQGTPISRSVAGNQQLILAICGILAIVIVGFGAYVAGTHVQKNERVVVETESVTEGSPTTSSTSPAKQTTDLSPSDTETSGSNDKSDSRRDLVAKENAKVKHITVRAVPLSPTRFAFLVTTADSTKKVSFEAWSERIGSVPPMVDEFGNTYSASKTHHRVGEFILGTASDEINENAKKPHLIAAFRSMPRSWGFGSGPVTADHGLSDTLEYQPLVPKAKKMFISLPAANVGGTGMLYFEFNADVVRNITAIDPSE